jgi:CubicO group peptidase (beta-lactamase class C family)
MALGSFGPVPEMGTSFGLGFAIRVDAGRNPMPGSVGDFSWGGITGTLFWVDPQAKLAAVLMAQSPRAMLNVIWRLVNGYPLIKSLRPTMLRSLLNRVFQ